jgi:hypothetical protein
MEKRGGERRESVLLITEIEGIYAKICIFILTY